ECESFNRSSERPYYVEISVGYHGFPSREGDNLSMMLKIADTKLYADKKKRRESVLRA
ncbi:MAG: diguanylate cyclase, partial [Lachnospiraceae bacterium]|nr:diguanylate cyclase [Lachnospiraceae bacterium]